MDTKVTNNEMKPQIDDNRSEATARNSRQQSICPSKASAEGGNTLITAKHLHARGLSNTGVEASA